MADENQLYGPDYEDQLFKQLSPAVEQRIRQTYANRGVKFGRAEGDVNEALSKLRQEIALQVMNKNAELKQNLLLRKTAEDEKIREEQRKQSRDIEERSYKQTQTDRANLENKSAWEDYQKGLRQKEFRDHSFKLDEAGIPHTKMSQYYAKNGDYEKSVQERMAGIGQGATAGLSDVNIYNDGSASPIETKTPDQRIGGFPENPPANETGDSPFPGSTYEMTQRLGVKNPWRRDPNDPRGSL